LPLQGLAAVAHHRLRDRDAGRADAVADGPVAGVEGGAGAAARDDDGRLVRGHGHRQRPDHDRRLLRALDAVHLLRRAGRHGPGDGRRAAGPAAAAEEGDAGGVPAMTRHKSWVLTDALGDVWVDGFAVANDTLRLPTPHAWSVAKRTLRGGPRDGIDLVSVHNGALSYAILPTRGMGLWRGDYRGLPLGWHSPVLGPVHPRLVEAGGRGGLGWLDGFDEWLCRCGLANNGPPGEDVLGDGPGARRVPLTLHGRIANLPAHHVVVRVGLEPPYELSVQGQVDEAALFFGHLRLTT